MPSLVSMDDVDDEGPAKSQKKIKPEGSMPKSKKEKDDDSFEALMKRSGTLKRISDIKENEQRVTRAGGAGAETKLRGLRAERERLEASLASGGAKAVNKPSKSSQATSRIKQEQPKPTPPPADDFDDMPPLLGEQAEP